LSAALGELRAACITVPPFQPEFLQRGHAIHFRCQHEDAAGMRVDVMSVLRGLGSFPELWARRTSLTDADGAVYELLSLPDLVLAKKTQRDKDWPMIRRLLEADYQQERRNNPDASHRRFWLRELRTPELLLEVGLANPALCHDLQPARPLLEFVESRRLDALVTALAEEEARERERDRLYWQPLKAELERLRHERGKNPQTDHHDRFTFSLCHPVACS